MTNKLVVAQSKSEDFPKPELTVLKQLKHPTKMVLAVPLSLVPSDPLCEVYYLVNIVGKLNTANDPKRYRHLAQFTKSTKDLKEPNMQIKSLHLKNYRSHESIKLQIKSKFTVLIGTNGSGKTSLLKAINELFGLAASYIPNVGGRIFADEGYAYTPAVSINGRYRFEPRFPVEVKGDLVVRGRESTPILAKASDIAPFAIENAEILSRVIAPSEDISDMESSALPLFAFYRSNRNWKTEQNDVMSSATEKLSRHDGYSGYYDAASNGKFLQNWIIAKCLERYQRSSETGMLFSEITDDELALANTALTSAIDTIGEMRYDMQQKSIVIELQKSDSGHRETVSLDHLSDGQRAVIFLIMDIARRACILNPQLGMNAIKATTGIVLVDELDIHLHPKWQRSIVRGLKAAFPGIQFITTTHSPQIIGELAPEEIIVLHQGQARQPQVSYGLDSSQILEEIMGSLSRNEETEANLERLFSAIENRELDRAKLLLKTIEISSPKIPELSKASALLKRIEAIGR